MRTHYVKSCNKISLIKSAKTEIPSMQENIKLDRWVNCSAFSSRVDKNQATGAVFADMP